MLVESVILDEITFSSELFIYSSEVTFYILEKQKRNNFDTFIALSPKQ